MPLRPAEDDPAVNQESSTESSEESEEGPGRHRDFVQSLERGLAIIRVFDADRPRLTVSEIAQVAGLTRAAVRRFLFTLTELGYVQPHRNGYELTPRVLELGYSYLSALTFPDVALPHLEKLVAETGEASEGSILDRGDVVYVVRVPGPALMTISVSIGARRPAYATAMGRALLADRPTAEIDDYLARTELVPMLPNTITDKGALRGELAKVREQGYALVNQELEIGLVAVAVPVHDRHGQTRAAINLSTHVGRKSVDDMRALVPRVQQAAADIELGLRHSISWAE
ncbi:IclR family transcriptional regulator domain-containing protein [Nocardioides flavescens]|uniref:Glycerol operon regulatory protein n=1 Tax=Nocardioides flavescens TaxID=2691959 RepID=A0A6L7ETK1_9ACTN|nr:IclR family transcriptional regulator C-terminal domain-containing protein [Nocardioides flavescens]MXG90040.1 helix-turn-helix domain-containing protein [Nocardioides flavescens]